MAASFELVMEVMSGEGEIARRLDPSGESSLRLAKRTRLDVMRNKLPSDYRTLRAFAQEHFGLPDYDLGYWKSWGGRKPWRTS